MKLYKHMLKLIIISVILSLFTQNTAFGWYDIEEPPPITKPSEKDKKTPKPSENQPLENTGTLYGKVISGETPLSGAIITLSNGMTAVSDAKGEYTITNIPPGEYSVIIMLSGYNTGNATINIIADQTKRVLATLSPNYMPPRSFQIKGGNELIEKQTPVKTSKNTVKSKEKEKGYITVTVYPQRDLTGGFKDNGKIWYVYSIRVEQIGGNLRWSDIYNRPSGYTDRAKELFCRGAIVGEEYRIEVEWKDLRSRDSRTRHWTKKMERFDTKFTFDSPSY